MHTQAHPLTVGHQCLGQDAGPGQHQGCRRVGRQPRLLSSRMAPVLAGISTTPMRTWSRKMLPGACRARARPKKANPKANLGVGGGRWSQAEEWAAGLFSDLFSFSSCWIFSVEGGL